MPKAKIGLDGTSLDERGKGVSRYLQNLLRELAKIDFNHQLTIWISKQGSKDNFPGQNRFTYKPVKVGSELLWKLRGISREVSSKNYDLIHVPNETAPFSISVPVVLTVHEIPKLRNSLGYHNEGFKFWLASKVNARLTARSVSYADKILCISKNTRRDLQRLYPVPEGKLKVVYYGGADPVFRKQYDKKELEEYRDQIGAHPRYILNFATGDSRENNEVVLEAYASLPPTIKDEVYLVFAGTTERVRQNLRKLAKKLEIIDSIIYLPFLQGEDLVKVYQAADLYVDISYYEGFGLQVVEAMASGTPVITSDAASLPEVVGEGGRLVGVEDKNGLTQEMISLLTDENTRKKLAEKAKKSAARFSWKKTAQETLKVWDQVLENPSL